MVAAISNLPDHTNEGKVLVKWSELPILASQWREGLFNWGETHKLSERINLTAFTAKLSTLAIGGVPSFTASATDFWVAFETTPDKADKLDRAAIQQLDANVPVAAQWVFYAGKEIYNCEENTQGLSEGLWNWEAGFGKARWNFWKQRANWVGEQQKLSKATREVALKMVEKMDEVEIADSS